MTTDEGSTSTGTARPLYLGFRNLDEADSRRLQVFLRFAGRSARYVWRIAQHEAEDLVIFGAPDGDATAPMPLEPIAGSCTTWILSEGQKSPEPTASTLRRPLQVEAFADVLRAREAQLDRLGADGRRAADASAAPPASRRASASRPPPAATSSAQDTNASRAARGRVYRMTRWPAPDLVRGRHKFVRVLGFLSHKPLDLERLSVLSGVDESTCLELLGLLDARGLLVVTEKPANSARRQESRATPAASHGRPLEDERAPAVKREPQPGAPTSLFGRLRRRLGIGLGD